MKKIALVVVALLLLALAVWICFSDTPPRIDVPLPVAEALDLRPSSLSSVGLVADIGTAEIDALLLPLVGTEVRERVGVSVKVRLHKVVLNKAEETAIKVWHETQVGIEKVRIDLEINKCNRHFRSKNRRNCRDKHYAEHEARKRDLAAQKSRRMAANRRAVVKGIEVVRSSGNDNYVIVTARLEAIEVSAPPGKIAVATRWNVHVRLNIENPLDHAKEIKGLVNTEFKVAVGVAGRIEFDDDGRLELADKEVKFAPRVKLPNAIGELRQLEDKINGAIAKKLAEQLDHKLGRVDVRQKLSDALVELVAKLNESGRERGVWVDPDFRGLSLVVDSDPSLAPSTIRLNLGVRFMPRLVVTSTEPAFVSRKSYDVRLSSEPVSPHLSVTASVGASLAHIQSELRGKIEAALNRWLDKGGGVEGKVRRRFEVRRVDVLTSSGRLVAAIQLSSPVSGLVVISGRPTLSPKGTRIELSDLELSVGTRKALSSAAAWVLDLPVGDVLAGKIGIDVSKEVAAQLGPIAQKGFPLGRGRVAYARKVGFKLNQLLVKDGNLKAEVNLVANVEIAAESPR